MSGKHVVGNKQWPHAPEALLRGRLVYTVKFYGDQEVLQAKGTEPIKEAVRKMKVLLLISSAVSTHYLFTKEFMLVTVWYLRGKSSSAFGLSNTIFISI